MSINQKTSAMQRRNSCSLMVSVGAGLTLLSTTPAFAFQFDTGNPDIKARWDNTLKYSAAWRVHDRDDKLIDGASTLNQDDGDRNFSRGLISNRFDLLSEFDLSYRNMGLRLSGAAWYDDVYNHSNDNDAPDRANQQSTSYDHFTSDTRDLHGRKAELLDAFVFANGNLDGHAVSGRLGQYAMQWGETLFFGDNGIAGGMAPVDAVKALSVPNTQFKELIRPVKQVSGQFDLTPGVSLGAYYQFEWEATRLPASGSYFSALDPLGEGGERILIPGAGGAALFQGKTKNASDSGQGGLQLRWATETVDYGLYAIRYHAKTPQLLVSPGANIDPSILKFGEYHWVYPEAIKALGASFSTTVSEFNLAGEISTRWDQPLASTNARALVPGEAINNDRDPLYATGRTLHANFSWLAALPPSWLSQEATFLGEVAWNRVLSVTKNPDAVDRNSKRDAWGLRMVYEPMYRQVMPGLDISVPLGLGFAPEGRSRATAQSLGAHQGGDVNIGIKGVYLNTWNMGLNYTHYYGPSDSLLDEESQYSYKQTFKDRDFISLSLSRTF